MSTPAEKSITRILAASEKVRRADQAASDARRALRVLMRDEIAARRVTKTRIAAALGVTRQRVGRMLDEL